MCYSGGVIIYFERIEVVNKLDTQAGLVASLFVRHKIGSVRFTKKKKKRAFSASFVGVML